VPASRFAVKDWMTPAPDTIGPERSVVEARRMMDAGGYRHLPVVEGARVIGIVSDRDLRSAWPSAALELNGDDANRVLDRTPVRRIMTQKPLVVGPHTSLADAARLLVDHQVGALPVMDGQQIIGILSEADALRAMVAALRLLRGSGRDQEPREVQPETRW
jgi:acetoin utilization protein AcuB